MLAIVLGLLPLVACQVLVGGPQTVDVNRDDIKTAAAFALGELNKLLGAQNTLVKVVSAKTQVVAGTNYILSLQLQQNGATKTCDVTVWSRPWLNDNRLTKHVCFDNKRAVMPGGAVNTSIHRTDVQTMANFALSEINYLTDVPNTLVEVVSAKTQVVAGTNYILTIRINDGSNTRTCDVTVWYQPWTDAKSLTKNTCTAVNKRSIPGGFSKIGVNDSEVQKVANFALNELNGLQGADNQLDEVVSAQVQVVAGLNYDLTIRLKNGGETQICKVKVWIQSWLNNQQMTQHTCSKVTKRAGGVLGGVSGVSTNDDVIQKMAAFAVTELNGLQNAGNSLVKVLSAKEQVVSGMKYILKLSLQEGSKTQICDVEIWNQPWMHHTELLSQHCVATSKRALLGGVVPGSLTGPVQKAVSFAEDALNAKSNNLYRVVTEKVDNIKEQLVAGVKYTFDLHLVTSSCSNADGSSVGKGINDCPANGNSAQHQTCTVSVLEQLWAKPQYTLLSDSCSQFF